MHNKLRAFAIALGITISPLTHADSFPIKPITLVSPYQAGGGADVIARSIAEAAARDLGQSIVVEPKPGAEGMIGALDVNRATPDGYRLLWGGSGSLIVNEALRKNATFDSVTSFTPIAATVEYSSFLYVHPSLPVKTMKEFIAYVKANPGKVTYATGHNQGMLQMADLAHKYALDMVRVQYKGEPSASTDLIANRVQAIFATSSLLPFVRDGKLKVLATSLSKRSSLMPEVPTLSEAGTPAAPFGGGFLAIYGPPKMPKDVVARLNRAFSTALKDHNVQEKLAASGLVYQPYTTNEELRKYMLEQRDLYRKTIAELAIPKE